MKKSTLLIILLIALNINLTIGQTTSTSDNMVAQPIPDRTVLFDY